MAIEATSLDTGATRIQPYPRVADTGEVAEEELSFWDMLDAVNPLQHLPIVGNIYRAVTGDEIKEGPRMMGGVLFGGVLGGASALVNIMVEHETGRDIGGNVIAAVFGDDAAPMTASAAARNAPLRIAPVDAPSEVAAATLPSSLESVRTAALPGTSPSADRPTGEAAATPSVPLQPPAAAASSAPASPATVTPVVDRPAAAAKASANATTGKPLSLAGTGAPSGAQNAGQTLRPGELPPHPTKLPPRTTVLANTAQARQVATEVEQRRIAAHARATDAATAPAAKVLPVRLLPDDRPGAVSGASTATASTAASGTVSPAATSTVPGFTEPVNPTTLPDVILRNLAKYEAARKAQSASSSVRVAG